MSDKSTSYYFKCLGEKAEEMLVCLQRVGQVSTRESNNVDFFSQVFWVAASLLPQIFKYKNAYEGSWRVTVLFLQLKALPSPARTGGGLWGKWTHECMAESLRCSPETTTTWFVNRLYPNAK